MTPPPPTRSWDSPRESISDHVANPKIAENGRRVELPRLMVVADVARAPGPLTGIVSTAAEHGARGFVLRARDLPPRDRAELTTALRAVLPKGCRLIVAAGTDAGRSNGASGTAWGPAVHLSATQEFPVPRPELVGRSCHNAAELDRAASEGCDYVFVSPVYQTASKPGYGPALGPDGLAALCRPGLPTYALGGVLPERVGECLGAGAYGVAVMGPVLHDPPIVAAYLAALSEVLPR